METPRPSLPGHRFEMPTILFVAAVFRLYYIIFLCVYTVLFYSTARVRRIYEERLGGNARRRDGQTLEVKIELDIFDLFLFCLTFFLCACIIAYMPIISFDM